MIQCLHEAAEVESGGDEEFQKIYKGNGESELWHVDVIDGVAYTYCCECKEWVEENGVRRLANIQHYLPQESVYEPKSKRGNRSSNRSNPRRASSYRSSGSGY